MCEDLTGVAAHTPRLEALGDQPCDAQLRTQGPRQPRRPGLALLRPPPQTHTTNHSGTDRVSCGDF